MRAWKLVVFDLDFTLWNAGGVWCDCTRPPYRKDGVGRVFDADGREIVLYPDVMAILEWLCQNGIPVALASRTHAPDWANQLTRLLGVDPFVEFRQIYPGSKIPHFERLRTESGVAYESMIFFDDEARNIEDVQTLGVRSILVSQGLTKGSFFPALDVDIPTLETDF